MTPIKLSIIGVYDADIEYSFAEPQNCPVDHAEKIKDSIGYVFYGNDALVKGKIVFEYSDKDVPCVIERNFETNTVSVVTGEKTVADEEANELLRKMPRLTRTQWDEFALSEKHVVFEGIRNDVQAFADGVLEELKIGENTFDAANEEYKAEMLALANKAEMLDEISDGKAEEYKEQLETLANEIKSIEEDMARLSELIGAGSVYKPISEKLDILKEELAVLKEKEESVESNKRKLARSRSLKNRFSMADNVANVEKESVELKKKLDELEEKLAEMNAQLTAGGKVLKKKERLYINANERVNALNIAFDEVVKESRENIGNDPYIKEHLEPFCKERDDTVVELRKIYEEKSKEKDDIDVKIAEIDQKWNRARLTADYRKAIREGACFETAIKEKKFAAKIIAKSIDYDNAEVEALQASLEKNKEIIRKCEERYEQIFSNNGRVITVKTLAADYNELEREKQSLYRNQILSAVLLQDINAIDKKIAENTHKKRSCTETKEALESAKLSLEKHVEKCTKKLEEQEKIYNEITAEKKYYENVDTLEYGAQCPICDAMVTDKPDVTAKLNALCGKQTAAAAEVTRYKGILKEYADKLDIINSRMGALVTSENASNAYIESLDKAKTAKLATLKKLYEENKVTSHDELTEALEKAIAEVTSYGTAISYVREIFAAENSAKSNIDNIKARLADLQNKSLPEKEAALVALDEDITKYENEYNILASTLEDKTALSQLDDIIVLETTDDECYEEYKELLDRRAELVKTLDDITADINALVGNEYKFTKDGKELDYTELCISITTDRYNEIIDEIRRSEEERLKAKDELVAVNRVVQNKQEKADELKAEYDEIKKKYDLNMTYAETVRESQLKGADEKSGKEYFSLKDDILDEKTTTELENEVLDYENNVNKYTSAIESLTEVVNENKEAYETLDENIAAAKELEDILNGRIAAYSELSDKYNFEQRIVAHKEALAGAQADTKKKLADVSNMLSGNASDLLITKTNEALAEVLPNYRVKYKDGGLLILRANKNGIEREIEKAEYYEYAMVSVAVSSAIGKIVSEAVNSDYLLRIVRIQYNLIEEDKREALNAFAKNNAIVLIYHK